MQNSRLFSALWCSVSAKRSLSSSSKASQRFYEYRTYSIKPKRFSKCEIVNCVSRVEHVTCLRVVLVLYNVKILYLVCNFCLY